MNTQEILEYVDEQNRKTRQYLESIENNSKFAEELVEELSKK